MQHVDVHEGANAGESAAPSHAGVFEPTIRKRVDPGPRRITAAAA